MSNHNNHNLGNGLKVLSKIKPIVWILLLLSVLFPAIVQAETKVICNNPDIKDNFSGDEKDSHIYGHSTLMCIKEYLPGCSKEFVFKTMISNPAFVAPMPFVRKPVTNCMKNTLPVGQIITTVNAENLEITNYTLDIHLLKPGKVTRTVVEKNGGIYISTVGRGIGILPQVNVVLGDQAFAVIDDMLREEVQTKLCEGRKCISGPPHPSTPSYVHYAIPQTHLRIYSR